MTKDARSAQVADKAHADVAARRPTWIMAPVVLLRQAGFPLSILDSLVAADLSAEVLRLADEERQLSETAALLLAGPRDSQAPGRQRAYGRLIKLRELTERDEAIVAGAGAHLVGQYQRMVRELAEHRQRYQQTFDDRLVRHRQMAADMFADNHELRQVLLVSNSMQFPVLDRWLDDRRGRHGRRITDLLAMYAQRVTAKSETHGHFGPCTVGRFGDRNGIWWTGIQAPETRAWLNHWSVRQLARVATDHPALRPLVRPRRHPWAFPTDTGIRRWDGTAMLESAVPDQDAWLWRLLDGEHTIAELRAIWRRHHPNDPAAACDAAIDRLAESGHALVEFDVAAGDRTLLPTLLRQLRGTSDRDADDLVARLTQLDAGIRRFAATTDTTERAAALDDVRERFESVTGTSADRLSGRFFADRTVFQEYVLTGLSGLTVGPDIADFLTDEFTDVYTIALAGPRHRVTAETAILADWLRHRFGERRPVPLDALYHRFAMDRDELADRCEGVAAENVKLEAELRDALLAGAPPDAHEVVVPPDRLAAIVRGLPSGPAAVLNPDVLFAAAGPDALAAGDFLAITGDFHAVRELLTQTPFAGLIAERAPEVGAEVYQGMLSLLDDDESLVDLSRNVKAVRLLLPCHDLEVRDRSPKPAGRVLRPADLHVVLCDGRPELRAAGVPGRLRLTAPPTSALSLAEDPLAPFSFPRRSGGAALSANGIDHLPRIRFGRTVLIRETWFIAAERFRSGADNAAHGSPDATNFAMAQALRAEFDLPRYVFAQVAEEPKPIYVDWDAPLLVRQLFRLTRKTTKPVRISEMFPAPGQEWLRVDGNAYVSELRCAVFGRGA